MCPTASDKQTAIGRETAQVIAEFLVTLAAKRTQDGNAERAYLWALELDPANYEAWNGLGRVALASKLNRQAMEYFQESLTICPTPAAYVNAAETQRRSGDLQEALNLCWQALSLNADFIHCYIERAAIAQQMGDEQMALGAIETGLALDPTNDMLLHARASIELARGDYHQGWKDYEHRGPRLDIQRKIAGAVPEWTGEPLTGKHLLVVGEQGIGDQIMFARYLPNVTHLPIQITFFTRPELARQFDNLGCSIVTSDREMAALRPDYWIPLSSLPLRLGGRRPGHYLNALSRDVDRFESLIPKDNRLQVGLCWAGNTAHPRDAERSLAFEQLKPLLDIPGVAFYSLQHGPAKLQAAGQVVDLDAYCHDLADQGAAMSCMDLIISVDTAALHLAGALGIPAWGLIYEPCDWRWDVRQSVPWYQSVKVFRQPTRGDWGAPILQAAAELKAMADAVPYHLKPDAFFFPEADPRIVTKHCRYGPMSFYPNDHYIGRSLELYGEYSQGEADLLAALLKPGDCVLEAGANIGALTVAMEAAVGQSGMVLAFEPQPAYSRLLCSNVTASHLCALGNSSERLTFHRIPLDVIHAPGWESTGEPFTVVQRRVDDFGLDDLHLIKIDVDGAEHEILKGAEQTIATYRPYLYVEYDKPERYPDMLAWIQERNYRIYQHNAPLYSPENFAQYHVNVFGSIVSLMLLCVPNERTLNPAILQKHQLVAIQ